MWSDDFTTRFLESRKKAKKDNFNNSLNNIKTYCDGLESRIETLEKENKELKDEHYNDSELQKMQ